MNLIPLTGKPDMVNTAEMSTEIGDLIRRWRLSRDGMRQEDLAAACGWPPSKSRVSMYERGVREPSFSDAETIARVFGVNLRRFLDGPDSVPWVTSGAIGELAPPDYTLDEEADPNDLMPNFGPTVVGGEMTRDPSRPSGWRWENEAALWSAEQWDDAPMDEHLLIVRQNDLHPTSFHRGRGGSIMIDPTQRDLQPGSIVAIVFESKVAAHQCAGGRAGFTVIRRRRAKDEPQTEVKVRVAHPSKPIGTTFLPYVDYDVPDEQLAECLIGKIVRSSTTQP